MVALQRGLIGDKEMKKGIIVALLLSVVFNLTACEVHFFDKKYDVKHFNKDLTLLFRLFYFLLKYINYKLK